MSVVGDIKKAFRGWHGAWLAARYPEAINWRDVVLRKAAELARPSEQRPVTLFIRSIRQAEWMLEQGWVPRGDERIICPAEVYEYLRSHMENES